MPNSSSYESLSPHQKALTALHPGINPLLLLFLTQCPMQAPSEAVCVCARARLQEVRLLSLNARSSTQKSHRLEWGLLTS